MFLRYLITQLISFIIITLAYCVFIIIFFIQYSEFTQEKMFTNINEYGEIDIHHLCNVTGCNAIYYEGKYYGYSKETNSIDIKYTTDVKIPKEIYIHDGISIREDFSFIISLTPTHKTTVFFSVNMDHFYNTFIILYVILLIMFNTMLFFMMRSSSMKDKIMHDIASSKDKAKLQFDNLMFFIENLNHEVNTPMFILSRKLKEIKTRIDKVCLATTECGDATDIDNTFKIIYDSIEQINSVMQRTREVKRINKISEDRTVADLIESTIMTVKIMRAEDFTWNVDPKLSEFLLDQTEIGNGTFINILTNHVKNSIEAFCTKFEITLVEVNNNKLVFDFSDDGNGIPEELRKKVFNKGFTTKGEKDERGSGLSINKDIIENCGGKIILVDSKVGTTFRITIQIKKNRR